MEIKPFEFPPGLRVVMGDVAAGSATPSYGSKCVEVESEWRRCIESLEYPRHVK